MNKYDDMLGMPPFRSQKHARMSMTDRAAQFSPFAALTGYDDAILETARLTDGELSLAEDELQRLNEGLLSLMERIEEQPKVRVTYFVPDKKKAGGKYVEYEGNVKRIDMDNRQIVFTGNKRIELEKIIEIMDLQ